MLNPPCSQAFLHFIIHSTTSAPRPPPQAVSLLGVVSDLVEGCSLLCACTPAEPSPTDTWSLRPWPPWVSEWALWLLPAEEHVLGAQGWVRCLRLRCPWGPSPPSGDTPHWELSNELILGRCTGMAPFAVCASRWRVGEGGGLGPLASLTCLLSPWAGSQQGSSTRPWLVVHTVSIFTRICSTLGVPCATEFHLCVKEPIKSPSCGPALGGPQPLL